MWRSLFTLPYLTLLTVCDSICVCARSRLPQRSTRGHGRLQRHQSPARVLAVVQCGCEQDPPGGRAHVTINVSDRPPGATALARHAPRYRADRRAPAAGLLRPRATREVRPISDIVGSRCRRRRFPAVQAGIARSWARSARRAPATPAAPRRTSLKTAREAYVGLTTAACPPEKSAPPRHLRPLLRLFRRLRRRRRSPPATSQS